jgi:bacterioferritin
MKGNPQVIDALNEVLTGELTSINQYFLHGRMCENWGYQRLWERLRHESIDEMKHADDLIARILYLEGVPNVQRLGKINVGESVREQLVSDRGLEADAVARLNKAIELCRGVGDHGSRELLERLLVSEEAHLNWIEAQLTLIEQVGEGNYLAQMINS